MVVLLFLSAFSAFGQRLDNSYPQEIAKYREEMKKGFLENPRSPLKTAAELEKLRFFDVNAKYRVKCKFLRSPNQQPFNMPTSSGQAKLYVKYGTVSFELGGKKLQLAVFQSITPDGKPKNGNGLFIPFRDETNGETTYGGGRYLETTTDELASKNPVLDFNKCYSPWCSYSDGFSCPIPPAENTLKIEILAGEKLWAGEKKH